MEGDRAYKGTKPLSTKDLEPEACGAELAKGGTCMRPANECPYHQD